MKIRVAEVSNTRLLSGDWSTGMLSVDWNLERPALLSSKEVVWGKKKRVCLFSLQWVQRRSRGRLTILWGSGRTPFEPLLEKSRSCYLARSIPGTSCLLGDREDADQVLLERGRSDPGMATIAAGGLWSCETNCIIRSRSAAGIGGQPENPHKVSLNIVIALCSIWSIPSVPLLCIHTLLGPVGWFTLWQ